MDCTTWKQNTVGSESPLLRTMPAAGEARDGGRAADSSDGA